MILIWKTNQMTSQLDLKMKQEKSFSLAIQILAFENAKDRLFFSISIRI